MYFSFRYTLYTKTRLGYMYFKREMRKAREQYPAGHSTAQPMELNGKVFYGSAGVSCCTSAVVVNKRLCIHTVQQKQQKPLMIKH